jgi:hypothetical protein
LSADLSTDFVENFLLAVIAKWLSKYWAIANLFVSIVAFLSKKSLTGYYAIAKAKYKCRAKIAANNLSWHSAFHYSGLSR